MARSRSLRSKQARSQRPDRFREGYLVNVNLRSGVPTRGNRARIYGYDIYVYVSPRCPFVVSTRERCCIGSVIHVPFEKRDLYGTSRVHRRESFVDIQVFADSDSESIRHKRGNMRDRCASCNICVIS